MTHIEGKIPIGRFLFLVVGVALLVRICVIPFLINEVVDPSRDHWNFGCEEGRIARSIASGEGFSSPLFGRTGPTGWSVPAYPYLLAGVFKLFGIYSLKSAYAILSLNALFSALTCVPVVLLMRRLFGDSAARLAGWVWVFFPYAIYFSARKVWDNSLTTLMLMLVLWATYKMERQAQWPRWLAYGVLWGIAALVNPVILSTFPALLGWLVYRRYKAAARWRLVTVTTVTAFCLTVSPWFIRNYHTFGRFIPFRTTFWMILWESNTGDTSDLYPDWSNPAHNDTEMKQYRELGEIGYVEAKRRLSQEFLSQHFPLFLRLTLQRMVFTWTGFWNLRPDYLSGEPFAIPNIAVCSLLTIFMIGGIRLAYLNRQPLVIPLLLVLAFYPVVFYVTHPGMDYRHPLDPLIIMFGAAWVSQWFSTRTAAALSAEPAGMEKQAVDSK